MEHEQSTTRSGGLMTSLVEDVFTLLRTETSICVNLLNDKARLGGTRTGAVMFVDGIQHVLHTLQQTHYSCRLLFLHGTEQCCAAANDFLRASELMEELADDWCSRAMSNDLPQDLQTTIRQDAAKVIDMYHSDAVMAAERTQVFIMRDINTTSIGNDFFSKAWEDEWTRNDVSWNLVSILEDHLNHIQRFLSNEYLFHKAVLNAAKAATCFYVRCLVNKADSVTRRCQNRPKFLLKADRHPFVSHERALRRMTDDIDILKDFFASQAGSNTAVNRMINDYMYILELIGECISAKDTHSLESFIVVLHKRTGADALVTRYFVGDLWSLMVHKKARIFIQEMLKELQPDLQMVTTMMKERTKPSPTELLSFVNLDDMLKVMYEDRVAQGILPCLPSVDSEEDQDEMVGRKIRSLTRKVVEFRWMKNRKKTKKNAHR